MLLIRVSRLAVAAAFLTAVVRSQTYVVDAANGPGTDFTSLATALATVPDGATVVVRPGYYQSPLTFTVTAKGLTIFGQPGSIAPFVTFTGLNANQRVVVKGMQFGVAGFNGALKFQNCLGPVHVEGCTNSSVGLMALTADQCSQVSIVRCTAQLSSFLQSDVVCVESTFLSSYGGGVGMTISGGRVQLVQCSVSGGTAAHSPGGDPAITMNGGELRLLGPGTMAAGALTVPSISGTGNVRATATISLLGAAPSTTINLVTVDEASTSSTGAPLGGMVTATLAGSANLLGGLVLGFPQAPTTFPDLAEELWVNPIGFAISGMLGAPLTFWMDVPNAAPLQGMVFGWQGVTFGPAGAVLSNPAWFCVQ